MLGDDIRARVRVLVTDLDQNPAPFRAKPPASLLPCNLTDK
jgi:hypothetical protein